MRSLRLVSLLLALGLLSPGPKTLAEPAEPGDHTARLRLAAEGQLAVLTNKRSSLADQRQAAEQLAGRYDQETRQLRIKALALFLSAKDQGRLRSLAIRHLDALRRPGRGADRARLGLMAALARLLVRLDAERARPVLRRATPAVCRAQPRSRGDHEAQDLCAWFFALRAELGEPKALREYAAWLGSLPLKRLAMSDGFPFLPAWRHPEHPAVAALLLAHFGPDAELSPWTPLFAARGPDLSELVSSPLLQAPIFRAHVLAQLDDPSPAPPSTLGRLMARENPPADLKRRHPEFFDTQAPDARMADLYARELAKIHGAPAFKPHAPRAERDASIAALKQFLREHGACLGEQDQRPAVELSPLTLFGSNLEAVLVPKEFAISGSPVRLPAERVRAWWNRPGGEPVFGWVQAGEESRVDGKPKRHFRFVWDHGVERLPAEALSFRGPPSYYGQQKTELGAAHVIRFGWPDPKANAAAGSLEYQPFAPNIRRNDKTTPAWKSAPDVVYRADRPLWMSVAIGNLSGYEQQAPAWSEPLAGGERPAGIQVELIGPAGPVPRRQAARERAPDETLTLLPGQSEGLFRLDLNAHFEIGAGGPHHLRLGFDGSHGLPRASVEQRFDFAVSVR